jgi:hypothetical protein
VQEGALFVVWQDEHQLFVRITCLKKVPKSGILEQAIPITPEFWLVEVGYRTLRPSRSPQGKWA